MRRAFARVGPARRLVAARLFQLANINGRLKELRPLAKEGLPRMQWAILPRHRISARPSWPTLSDSVIKSNGRRFRYTQGLASKAAHVTQHFRDKLTEHRTYVNRHGEHMPEIQKWSWPSIRRGPQRR